MCKSDIFHLSLGGKSEERCLSGSMVAFSLAITSTSEEKPVCVTALLRLYSQKLRLVYNVMLISFSVSNLKQSRT